MLNYYYSDKISDFFQKLPETIIGEISVNGRCNTEKEVLDLLIEEM